jgi:hypothetical protein
MVLVAWAFIAVAAARVVVSGGDGRNVEGTQPVARQMQRGACGRVAAAQARGSRFVAPSLALECLNSVPLDVERDSALVD